MWDYLTPENLIRLQRKMAFDHLGEQARTLQQQGYEVEADEVLDVMIERRESWNDGQ